MLVYTVCGFITLFIVYDPHMASILVMMVYYFNPQSPSVVSTHDFKDERLDTVSDVISDNHLIIYGIIFWYIYIHLFNAL